MHSASMPLGSVPYNELGVLETEVRAEPGSVEIEVVYSGKRFEALRVQTGLEVCFAEECRRVTGGAKQSRNRRTVIQGQARPDVKAPVPRWIFAGENRAPRRGAYRIHGVSSIKKDSPRGQAIERRCFDCRILRADGIPPLLIARNKKDIRSIHITSN
jgi:hypothetical protein